MESDSHENPYGQRNLIDDDDDDDSVINKLSV